MGNVGLASLLIGAKANVNAVSIKPKESVIHRAIRFKREEMVKLLLFEGADMDLQDGNGGWVLV